MRVTVKAIPVFYDGDRYLKGEEAEIKDKHFNKDIFIEVKGEQEKDDKNLFDLSEAELKKVNKDEVKAFLEAKEIDYDSGANKDELVALVLDKKPEGDSNGQ